MNVLNYCFIFLGKSTNPIIKISKINVVKYFGTFEIVLEYSTIFGGIFQITTLFLL